jgi:hypothetical protein
MITLGMAATLAGSIMAAPAGAGPFDGIGGGNYGNPITTDPGPNGATWSPTSVDLGTLEAGDTRTAKVTLISPTNTTVNTSLSTDATCRVERITSYKTKWVQVGSGPLASWESVEVVDQSATGNAAVAVQAQQRVEVEIRATGLDNGVHAGILAVFGATWRVKVPVQVTVYGSTHQLYRFNGSAFVRIPGSLRQIGVGSYVWGVNDRDEVFRYNSDTGLFARFPNSPNLRQIVVGGNGSVWGLTRDGEIYHLNKESDPWYFEAIPGRLTQIAIGGTGIYETVWGLNAAGEVYRFNTNTRRFEGPLGRYAQIAAGAYGDAWVLGEINASAGDMNLGLPGRAIYKWGNGFQPVPGSLAQIALGSDGAIWGLDPLGAIFRWDKPLDEFVPVPGRLAQIALGSGRTVWGLTGLGEIYTYNVNTQRFKQVAGQLSRIAVRDTGDVWGIKDLAVPAK